MVVRVFGVFSLTLFVLLGCRLNDDRVRGSYATQKPSPPTIVNLDVHPTGLNQLPAINWNDTANAKRNVSYYQARIVTAMDGSPVTDWVQVEESQTASLSTSLDSLQVYKVELKAVDSEGNASASTLSPDFIPASDDCVGEALSDSPFANSSSGGDGLTASTAFKICTADQLNAIGADTGIFDKYFSLAADIDLSGYTGTEFNLIGFSGNAFSGEFAGNGRVIHNFTYSDPSTDYIGLFGYIQGPAKISDLELKDVNVEGQELVGALVGAGFQNTEVSNCHSSGIVSSSVTSGNSEVGGLVGYHFSSSGSEGRITSSSSSATVTGGTNTGGLVGLVDQYLIVTDSFATGPVTGGSEVGGLIGYAYFTSLTRAWATGDVSATGGGVGGLVGGTGGMRTIKQSYATGNVSAPTGSNVGGLIGYAYGAFDIEDSYARGDVSGVNQVGGLVGYNLMGIIRSYATGDVLGADNVGGLAGALDDTDADVIYSFATGNVEGTSGTNSVSELANDLDGGTAIFGNYYNSAATCTNNSGSCTSLGTGVDLGAQPTYFYSSGSAPLTNWDFSTIWMESADDFPSL